MILKLAYYDTKTRNGTPSHDHIIAYLVNYIYCIFVWDEITYPFPNFNGPTIDVCKWTYNFLPVWGQAVTWIFAYCELFSNEETTEK